MTHREWPRTASREAMDRFWPFEEEGLGALAPLGVDRSRAKASARLEILEDLRWLKEQEWCERYVRNCPVSGAVAEDYLGRLIEIEGRLYFVHIRFEGLDLDRPFVGILRRDGALGTAPEIAHLVRILAGAFALFHPRDVRVYCWEEEERGLSDVIGFGRDQRFVAGRIDVLRQRPRPEHFDRVELRRPEDLSCHDRIVEIYKGVAEIPELRPAGLRPQPMENYEACLSNETFFEVHVDGTWAGVVAANRSHLHGLDGFLVVEELLAPEFRGRGLAPSVQRHLIDTLPAEGHDALFGEIAPENLPSLRTAFRCGRRDFGGTLVFPCD